MTNDSLISEQSGSRRLRVWNPLDHLRLVWWILFAPECLAAYWRTYGENAETKLLSWWDSTLIWFPLGVHEYFIKGALFTVVLAWFFTSLGLSGTLYSIGRTARLCWMSVFYGWMLLICLKLNAPWFVPLFLFFIIFVLERSAKPGSITNAVIKRYKNSHTSWVVWLGFVTLVITYGAMICILPLLL